jgi:hypothetical protein
MSAVHQHSQEGHDGTRQEQAPEFHTGRPSLTENTRPPTSGRVSKAESDVPSQLSGADQDDDSSSVDVDDDSESHCFGSRVCCVAAFVVLSVVTVGGTAVGIWWACRDTADAVTTERTGISIATWNIQPALERTSAEKAESKDPMTNYGQPAGYWKKEDHFNLDNPSDRVAHYENVGRALGEVAVDRGDKADFFAIQEYGNPESDRIKLAEGSDWESHVNDEEDSQAKNPVRILAREKGYEILEQKGNPDYNKWYAVHLLYDKEKWELKWETNQDGKDEEFQIGAGGREKRPCKGGFFTRKDSKQSSDSSLPAAFVLSCHLPHCRDHWGGGKDSTNPKWQMNGDAEACETLRNNLEVELANARTEIQKLPGSPAPGSYAEIIAGDFNEFGWRTECRVGTEENHAELYKTIRDDAGANKFVFHTPDGGRYQNQFGASPNVSCLEHFSSPEDEISVLDKTLDWGFAEWSEPADRVLYRLPQGRRVRNKHFRTYVTGPMATVIDPRNFRENHTSPSDLRGVQSLVKYDKDLAQTYPFDHEELSDHRPRRAWIEVN